VRNVCYFAPDATRKNAPVVNMGFVLNVIEDPAEQIEVLQDDWNYAAKKNITNSLVLKISSKSFEVCLEVFRVREVFLILR